MKLLVLSLLLFLVGTRSRAISDVTDKLLSRIRSLSDYDDIPTPHPLDLTRDTRLAHLMARRDSFAKCIVNQSVVRAQPPITSVDLLTGCSVKGPNMAPRPTACVYEIFLCPRYGIAFYHIYKAAGTMWTCWGTTGSRRLLTDADDALILFIAGTMVKEMLRKYCVDAEGNANLVRFANAARGMHLDPESKTWAQVLDDYNGFTIVREPVSRFVSSYHEEVRTHDSHLAVL